MKTSTRVTQINLHLLTNPRTKKIATTATNHSKEMRNSSTDALDAMMLSTEKIAQTVVGMPAKVAGRSILSSRSMSWNF